jgi:hypothetical protein
MARIIEVRPSDDFKLYVKYSDGLDGFINMKKMLKHKDYECIRELEEFKKVSVDPKSKDITWECGATMCKVATRSMLKLLSEMRSLGLNPD